MFTSMGYRSFRADTPADEEAIIVIDAGHGGEDPGAVDNGLFEKDLNLDIAKALNEIEIFSGNKTLMTRTDDRLLYNVGEENRKKFYDLYNRLNIAESLGNSVFVSIHINKFTSPACKGVQTFYSDRNTSSRILAESVRKSTLVLQPDNQRPLQIADDNIYILYNISVPAILVECGFISNSEEAALLKTTDYKNALALTVHCGIAEYLEADQ